jgi:branched-chain amino acid transport system ATP-binding protein
LVVSALSAGYGREPVVSDISVNVTLGEVVSVIGPNGAGKSTVLKAMAGMIPVMAGKVTLNGEDVTNLRSNRLARRGLGYVPQTEDVFEGMSVLENLEMGGYLLPRKVLKDRVEQVTVTFPALARMLRRSAAKLSGGERKMLAIGRVLMLSPKALLLDEPSANLSPDLAAALLGRHIRHLANGGRAVFMVEQRARAALQASDRAYVFVSGRVSRSAPASELLSRVDVADELLG